MLDTRYQAKPSAPSGPTGRLCDFVASIELDDVPYEVRTYAKHLILDGIACALVGAQLPWSRTATKAILEMEGSGNCTVIGWNQRLNPMSAAILNSTFIQGFELDDVHADAPWHANSVILPSLFAAAEHASRGMQGPRKFDGASFLLSTIVGFEVGSRVGLALYGSEMLSRGWHSVSRTHATNCEYCLLMLERALSSGLQLQLQQHRNSLAYRRKRLRMHSAQPVLKHAV